MSQLVEKTGFKYQAVRRELYKRVREAEVGAQLPPVNAFLKEFGVSRSTLDRVLGELRSKGWINSVPRKGLFVSRPGTLGKGGMPEIIDYVFFGDLASLDGNTFHGEVLSSFIRVAGSRGAAVKKTAIKANDAKESTFDTLDGLGSKFMVLVGLDDKSVLDFLDQRMVPYVLLLPNYPEALPNSLLIDAQQIVKTWVRHLTELGHTSIAFLHGVTDSAYIDTMHQFLRYFYEEMARQNVMVDPDLVAYGGFTPEEGYQATVELFAHDKEFSALIINDSISRGVYSAIRECGLVVGRDISVIATDDMPWCSHMHPRLSSTRVSREQMAKILLELIEEMMLSGERQFAPRFLPVDLNKRESTGPAISNDRLQAVVQSS